jgi:hypothetical protein
MNGAGSSETLPAMDKNRRRYTAEGQHVKLAVFKYVCVQKTCICVSGRLPTCYKSAHTIAR